MFGFEAKKFGVEIEFAKEWLTDVERIMQRELQGTGITVAREGYNHHVRNYWKLVSDASVSERINYGSANAFGGELVSPVLQGQSGLDELFKVCAALNACPNVKINIKCGLHLHLSWANPSVQQIKNIVARYAHFETDFDSMMPASRHDSQWCANISRDTPFLRSVARYTGTIRGLVRCGGPDRYRKVNILPLRTYGSIEFRQHSGTTDFEKIKNWILLMSDFCDASQTQSSNISSVTSIDFHYRRTGQQRAYAEMRELLEAHNITLDHTSRGIWIAKKEGNVLGRFDNSTLLALYERGAVNPRTGTRTRQRGATFNASFAAWFSNLTGTSTSAADTFFRGVRDSVAAYVRGRMNHFATRSRAAA